jgi:hypothetical protein
MPNVFPALTGEQLKKLQALDTCSVSNAIEQFDVRLRNEGFLHDVGCLFAKSAAYARLTPYRP